MSKRKQLQAFYNDPEIKKKYVDRLKLHRKHDQIVHGKYWENGKGCAVGCTIHGADHERYESEMGIPSWVAHLEDQLFEDMGNREAKNFPVRLTQAIPVGMTEERFNIVKHKFLIYVLEKHALPHARDDTKRAIQNVINLHRKAAYQKSIKMSEWEAAEAAARAAADAAADAAAWPAEDAARGAARAARAADASGVARAAARAVVNAAAWSGAAEAVVNAAVYNKMAQKLIELFREED